MKHRVWGGPPPENFEHQTALVNFYAPICAVSASVYGVNVSNTVTIKVLLNLHLCGRIRAAILSAKCEKCTFPQPMIMS